MLLIDLRNTFHLQRSLSLETLLLIICIKEQLDDFKELRVDVHRL